MNPRHFERLSKPVTDPLCQLDNCEVVWASVQKLAAYAVVLALKHLSKTVSWLVKKGLPRTLTLCNENFVAARPLTSGRFLFGVYFSAFTSSQ